MSSAQDTHAKIPILAIVGPTATGKSALAITLAKEHGAEVVNADSRLVYRGMDIGTAKPSPAELASVPHHVIDLVSPSQSFHLAAFLGAARSAIADIHARGAKVIVVGGSGQYVWALLEGWNVPGIPVDANLRSELELLLKDQGLAHIQERLLRLDASAPAKVDMQNPRRVLRAIERAIATGDAMGGASKSDSSPYADMIIGLTASRDELNRRIVRRIDAMLSAGWLDEVRALRSQGIYTSHHAMYSIGYREMMRHINGELELDAAKELVASATMRLVDAQENWFKKSDERITWFDTESDGYPQPVHETITSWDWSTSRDSARR